MLHYVKPIKTEARPNPAIADPVRRGRLPVDVWRPVEPSSYWSRLAREGSVELRRTAPPEKEIEGYEAPAMPPAAAAKSAKPAADEGSAV